MHKALIIYDKPDGLKNQAVFFISAATRKADLIPSLSAGVKRLPLKQKHNLTPGDFL
jgi:hypothetical protein